MDIVVYVPCSDQESTFQVFGDLGILFDTVFEFDVPFFINDFIESMMLLTPQSVVDVILVIARR